jgi:hypothetical protein
MKYVLIAAGLLFGTANLQAQTAGTGQKTGGATSSSSNTSKGKTSAGNNIPQSHGSKDLTPGSPVGTGGAGGGDMSGSPAGSAIQTKDQTSKAVINTNQIGKKASATKRTTKRKTSTTNRKASGR